MDSPICSKRNPSGSRIEIYPDFGRIVAPDGDILMEFAAAHVRRKIDAARWPVALPPGLPEGAIAIDRYGDYRPGWHTPHGITDPELVAAIRAMRPADVSHMQCHNLGCGCAVVAHLTGQTYGDTVRKLFPRSHEPRKIGTLRLAELTHTARRICESRTWAEAGNAKARAALIKSRKGYQHYVAIAPGAVIVDPELVRRYPLAEYPRADWKPVAYFVRE